MPDEHARLSPSSAERWISCPASLRMADNLPAVERHGEDNVYAAEGTAAHALAEMKARLRFGQMSQDLFDRKLQVFYRNNAELYDLEAMERHTGAYVDLLEERMSEYEYSVIFIEQRLQTGIPESWGTTDATIVSPWHVDAIDLKYGQGYAVEARNNPQLRLYAVGALDTFGDLFGKTERVRCTVFQPRLNHTLTEELTPAELRAWRDNVVRPAAELALSDDAPFGPSEKACRWCPASGRCPAQLADIFSTPFDTSPEYLSPEQMSETLERVPRIRQWLSAFEEAALTTAYSEGVPIPGWKVVMSGGKRRYIDPAGAVVALWSAGVDVDDWAPRSPRGIGELEKFLGKIEFARIVGPYVKKGDGSPSLVPEDDRRSPIDPNQQAVEEFRNR